MGARRSPLSTCHGALAAAPVPAISIIGLSLSAPCCKGPCPLDRMLMGCQSRRPATPLHLSLIHI
eukprot:13724287-Alexandrium_andersonii.AAC.1